MGYKTELHCHSIDGSPCSHETADKIAEKYLKYGYSTILLTNHFTPSGNIDDINEWTAKIDRKYAAYDKLVKAADGRLNILMGLEFRFVQNSNDYLVFGFDRQWLIDHTGELLKGGIRKFTETARPDGIMTIHAHPFRYGMVVTPYENVDGIEVFNGHPRHNSNNDIARAWGEKSGKIMTSGSDHHDPDHIPSGGIVTDEEIKTERQLIEVLKSGKYELIRNTEIMDYKAY